MIQLPNGTILVSGDFSTSIFGGRGIGLLSVIDDQYAFKNSLFTFKIPVIGDTLNYGYSLLKAPLDMEVSSGGTISWFPKTDSIPTEQVQCIVLDDKGGRDTVTFMVYLNQPGGTMDAKHPNFLNQSSRVLLSVRSSPGSGVSFSFPSTAPYLSICNLQGKQIEHIALSGTSFIWKRTSTSGTLVSKGTYVARIEGDKINKGLKFVVLK